MEQCIHLTGFPSHFYCWYTCSSHFCCPAHPSPVLIPVKLWTSSFCSCEPGLALFCCFLVVGPYFYLLSAFFLHLSSGRGSSVISSFHESISPLNFFEILYPLAQLRFDTARILPPLRNYYCQLCHLDNKILVFCHCLLQINAYAINYFIWLSCT